MMESQALLRTTAHGLIFGMSGPVTATRKLPEYHGTAGLGRAAASTIVDHLRRRFARFKLRAHFLDLHCLLVETRSKLRNRRAEVLF